MCYGFGEECDCNNNGWLIPTRTWATLYFPKSLMKGFKHGCLSYTPSWWANNCLWKRCNLKLFSFLPFIHNINYVLQFSCLVNESNFFFKVVGILSVLNLATLPFWKLCAQCHALDIVVSTTMVMSIVMFVMGRTPQRRLNIYVLQLQQPEIPSFLPLKANG